MTDIAALSHELQAERAAMAALVALLREEEDALLKGDAERLGELGTAKGRYLAGLKAHADQRRRLLLDAGRTPGREGMEDWIRALGATAPRLPEDWRELLVLTRTAQQINQSNGNLIDARLRVTQQALRVMFSATSTLGTYGADGGTVNVGSARELAVA